jgi:hypothetical protein
MSSLQTFYGTYTYLFIFLCVFFISLIYALGILVYTKIPSAVLFLKTLRSVIYIYTYIGKGHQYSLLYIIFMYTLHPQ